MLLPPARQGIVDAVDGELAAGMIGLLGTVVVTVGMALGPGTASNVLMPRLPISVDPKGIPTPRPELLAVEVGVDEAAGFVAPEPHMLERPEVSIIAVVAESAVVSGDIAEPDIALAMLVLGLVASESPPPSYVALEPTIVEGAMPAVEQTVAVPAGGATVGNGLTPGEAISVAPNGIPVPPTAVLGPIPSGEVAPIVGTGAAIPVTCAMAALLAKNTTQAVMSEVFICISKRVPGFGRPGSASDLSGPRCGRLAR
jgi:hypothetical protein